MGFTMDNLHSPTVGTSGASSNGNDADTSRTFQELITRKENLEAELSALGSVLDSVCALTVHATVD
jgi:26S proteasome non-ATPase regulatory subunit 9